MKRISVLMAIVFVDMIGFAIIFPLLPFYALRMDVEPWVIGWLIATFSVAQLASAPWWGKISDRYGRRPALLLGLGWSAVAFVIFGFATSVWMLFLSRLIQGLAGGTTGVVQAYVGDAIEPRQRAKALGWISSATSAGVMIGPAIGSLSYSLGPEAPGIIAASLCLLNVLAARRLLPESHPHRGRNASGTVSEEGHRPVRGIGTMVAEVLRSPQAEVPRLVWIYAVGMLGFMSMAAVLALYLESFFGITAGNIGFFFVYTGALSIVMRALVLGKLVDRFGETKVMRLGASLLALGLLAIPVPDSLFGLLLVITLVPAGTALLFPSVTALVTHGAEKQELGQTLGVQQAFGGAARVIAPVSATAVFQGVGEPIPFFIAGGVVAFVTLLAFRVPAKVPAAEAA